MPAGKIVVRFSTVPNVYDKSFRIFRKEDKVCVGQTLYAYLARSSTALLRSFEQVSEKSSIRQLFHTAMDLDRGPLCLIFGYQVRNLFPLSKAVNSACNYHTVVSLADVRLD